MVTIKPEFKDQSLPESVKEFFKVVRDPPIRSTPLGQGCPRKLLYAYKWGIQPKNLERALEMGTFVHVILQALYLGKTETEALASAEALMTKHHEELRGWADKAGFLPGGHDLKATLEDLTEDYHKARAMAICFWRFVPFKAADWEVLRDPDGNPMVERLLEAQIEGLEVPALVPCDLILKSKKTGEVWIVDFKTTKYDPSLRAISTKFSTQLALYRLVLQAHLDSWDKEQCPIGMEDEGSRPPKLRVAGSYHAILKKPTIKYCPDTKDAGGFHKYIERLVKWYKDETAKDPKNPPLTLVPNRFSGPPMTAELWHKLCAYEEMATEEPDLVAFPRQDNECLKYNRPCQYVTLCQSDPVTWPHLVQQYYQIKFREDTEELGARRSE